VSKTMGASSAGNRWLVLCVVIVASLSNNAPIGSDALSTDQVPLL
jgi:hypothetical protein